MGAKATVDHRHHDARRAPIAVGDPDAVDRHDQRGPRLCRQSAAAVSVECWGGATFDVAYRFLQECPWQRLRDMRAAMPNLMTQMLLRGLQRRRLHQLSRQRGAVFRAQAAETGVDVFRVFDSLNWVENMRVAMDAVSNAQGLRRHNLLHGRPVDPDRAKYDLKYYVEMGKELESGGRACSWPQRHGGLLKPAAGPHAGQSAESKRSACPSISTPMTHRARHCHDPAAAEAGVDAVDAAMDAFSGNTSSPRWARLSRPCAIRSRHRPRYAAHPRDSDYWEAVRGQYAAFESGCRPPLPRSICTKCPAGSSPTSRRKRASLGLEDRWHEVAQTYADVNQMFGDIVKVTPSSKVVGDMALMMVSKG